MITETQNPKAAITEAERLGADFILLIEFFRYGTHLQESYVTSLGIDRSVAELVNLGWLRRVKGPCRYDTDWLSPSGALATHVAAIRGSRVAATWANYQDRRAA